MLLITAMNKDQELYHKTQNIIYHAKENEMKKDGLSLISYQKRSV